MPIPSHWGKAEKESDDRLTCHSGRLYPRDKTQFKTFFISHPILGQLWGVQLKLSNFLVQWRPNAFAPALIPLLYLCTNFKVYGIHCFSGVIFYMKTIQVHIWYEFWINDQCHKMKFSYYLLCEYLCCALSCYKLLVILAFMHCMNNLDISTSFAWFNAMLKFGSFLKLEKVSTFTVKSTDLGKISIPSHNERANFESTVWHVENSEVARGLNALRCKVEVDKLEWMNMRKGRSFVLAGPKKAWRGQAAHQMLSIV